MITIRKKIWLFTITLSVNSYAIEEDTPSLSPYIRVPTELYSLKVIRNTEKLIDQYKFKLGKCKNVNMDNEIRNMELLKEKEDLKKELKVCK